MSKEFIYVTEIAQGPVALRYSEIVHMETLPSLATRVYLSLGYPIIVAESQADILHMIARREAQAES